MSTQEQTRNIELSGAADVVAGLAATQGNRAFVRLMTAKIESIKDELTYCTPEQVPALQESIRTMRVLINVANGHAEAI